MSRAGRFACPGGSLLWALVLVVATRALAQGLTSAVPQRHAGDASTERSALDQRLQKTAGLVAQAAARDAQFLHSDLYALVLLKLEQARLAYETYWPGAYRDGRVGTYLDEAEHMVQAILGGANPVLQTRGRIERAYLASNDGSTQPYLLYVPESYDGLKDYGLLVYLHGYSPNLNKENWVRYMYADVLDQYAEQTDSILLMPFARSNTDFQGVGEDDVMLMINRVMRDYRIAPDRVVLSGYSMGGMGAWTIGGHYPDRFAGLMAMSGRGDFYLWKGLKREGLPGFKRKLAEQEFGANLLPNYLHLPLFLVHGNQDWGIPVEQSRRMHDLLKALGMDVRYVELEGEDHFFFYQQTQCLPDLLEWLRARKRVSSPRRIAFRTYSLKYNCAYWVEILGIDDWGRAAEVTCDLSEDGGALAVNSDNVTGLRLALPRELVKDPAVLRITWNGRPAPASSDKAGLLMLGNRGPGEGAVVKTPAPCGPIREAFAGPFVMAYGGKAGGLTHERALRAAADWEEFAKGVPRLIPASEVTDELMAGCNLILFGSPEDNPLIGKLMPHLPVKIEGGFYQVGTRRYDAGRFGLWVIHPNPLAPGRYVAINSGPAWGRELAENHKYDFIPDFIVYADEKSEDGTECNKYVCAGFFDQRWQLSKKSTWYSEQPR